MNSFRESATGASRLRVGAALGVGLLAVSFGGVFAALAAVEGMPALTIAFWRCALATPILFGIGAMANRAANDAPRPIASARTRWLTLAAGALLAVHFGAWIASFAAGDEAWISMPASVLLVTQHPLLVALGSIVFLRERPSRRQMLGIGVCLAGLLVWASGAIGPGDSWKLPGVALSLLGAAAIAGYLLIGRAVRRAGWPLTRYLGAVTGIAAALLFVAAMLAGDAQAPGWPWAGFEWALSCALVPMMLGHALFNWVLAHVEATVVSTVVLGEIVIAALLGWALLDVPLTTSFALASALVLSGLAALVWPGASSAPPREPQRP